MESRVDFIDSEMSRCMEELIMLQSKFRPAVRFKMVLMSLVLKVKEVLDGVNREAGGYGIFVYMIFNAISESVHEIEKQNINSQRDWKNVVSEVATLKRTLRVLSVGAALLDVKLEEICRAIHSGLSSTSESLRINMKASADSTMLALLSRVGSNLRALSDRKQGSYPGGGKRGRLQ